MKLRVTSARERFRRSGVEFTREPRVIDTEELGLTEAQVEAIRAEPNLNVRELTKEEVAALAGDAKPSAKKASAAK